MVEVQDAQFRSDLRGPKDEKHAIIPEGVMTFKSSGIIFEGVQQK